MKINYGWFTVEPSKNIQPMTTSEKATVLVGCLAIAACIAWLLWRSLGGG